MESLNDLNESLFNALDEFKQNEKEFIQERDENSCINCEKNTIQNLKGELICSNCGYFSGINIDNGAEWRYYGSEDSKSSDPNRCGMPNSILFYLNSH